METAVFVIGAGVISGIGQNVAACLDALENSKAGIGQINYLRTNHSDLLPAAEVKSNNRELAAISGFTPATSRTAMLSMIAAREAWDSSAADNFPALRRGFVSASTTGGIDKSEDFFVDFLKDTSKGRLSGVINHECDRITTMVADKLGIRDHISTISTACS
jgi:3-oxoacyl-[acyl-carrier-protein] synthase-1